MSMIDLLVANHLSGSYPLHWDDFIGQESAKRQLKIAAQSASLRGTALPHTLLASGMPGIGKTTLGLLCAAEMGVGLKIAAGQVDGDAARLLLAQMQDGDILLLDEVHQLVAKSRRDAEWLLHLLQDGTLIGPHGAEKQPMVGVIATTTDAGRLPDTIVSRFQLRPTLTAYTDGEAMMIAARTAGRMLPPTAPKPSTDDLAAVARAGSNNPRTMQQIIANMRDLAMVEMDTVWDGQRYVLAEPLSWLGLSEDGLTAKAIEYLTALATEFQGKAGERALQDRLREPGGVRYIERELLDRGLIALTKNGRTLTQAGIKRALEEKRS